MKLKVLSAPMLGGKGKLLTRSEVFCYAPKTDIKRWCFSPTSSHQGGKQMQYTYELEIFYVKPGSNSVLGRAIHSSKVPDDPLERHHYDRNTKIFANVDEIERAGMSIHGRKLYKQGIVLGRVLV